MNIYHIEDRVKLSADPTTEVTRFRMDPQYCKLLRSRSVAGSKCNPRLGITLGLCLKTEEMGFRVDPLAFQIP